MKDDILEDYVSGNLGKDSTLGKIDTVNRIIDIEFQNLMLEHYRSSGNRHEEANALVNLGQVYLEIGETERGIQFFTDALTINRQLGDRNREAALQGFLGNAYLTFGKISLAIECFRELIEIAQEIGNRKVEGVGFHSVTLAYWLENSWERAIKHAQTALDIFEEIGAAEEAARTRNLLFKLRTQSTKKDGKKWWQLWK